MLLDEFGKEFILKLRSFVDLTNLGHCCSVMRGTRVSVNCWHLMCQVSLASILMRKTHHRVRQAQFLRFLFQTSQNSELGIFVLVGKATEVSRFSANDNSTVRSFISSILRMILILHLLFVAWRNELVKCSNQQSKDTGLLCELE